MSSHEFDPLEATIPEIHAAMEAGETTAERLVERYLARIEAYDDELNAILTVNEAARDRAVELDERLEAEEFVGPLHGIPVVLKDNHDTADLPTTAGSTALAESVPREDAFVVERLRAAGGIVLAKANLQEFAFGVDTVSSLGGETRNAYDTDRRPAGSSGGSAAAVAANLGAVATGSDTCSSVRSPPAFHALVGIRPTRGLVSSAGLVPLSETQDTSGPIARTVEDAARLLEAMAGYDPADPVTGLGADELPEEGYVDHLDPDGLSGARIGVVRAFFGLQDPDSAPASEAETVTSVLESAIDEIEAAGATTVDLEEAFAGDARVLPYEFARDLREYLAGLEDPPYESLSAILEAGHVADAVAERIRAAGILEVDIEGPSGNVEYLRRLAVRREKRVTTLARMADEDLDALLYPPSTIPPVEIPDHQPFAEMNCELAAHTGLPAIVVPAGFTDAGLPVGLELLGRPFDEPRLLELAYAFERATGHRRPPEGFGP